MKPNHHFLVHLPAQIQAYGPVYGFWCFLGERLNKLLKSFKSNNWGGGQLEVSMVREWGRDVQMHETVSELNLARNRLTHSNQMRVIAKDPNMREYTIANYLLKLPTEVQGTVEAVAARQDEAITDGE